MTTIAKSDRSWQSKVFSSFPLTCTKVHYRQLEGAGHVRCNRLLSFYSPRLFSSFELVVFCRTTKISGGKSRPQHNQDLSTVCFIDLLGCRHDHNYPFNHRLTKSIGKKWLPTPLLKLTIGLNSHLPKIPTVPYGNHRRGSRCKTR